MAPGVEFFKLGIYFGIHLFGRRRCRRRRPNPFLSLSPSPFSYVSTFFFCKVLQPNLAGRVTSVKSYLFPSFHFCPSAFDYYLFNSFLLGSAGIFSKDRLFI